MAVSRTETSIVLGLASIVIVSIGYGAWRFVKLSDATAPAPAAAAVRAVSSTPSDTILTHPSPPPAPFIATVDNERTWRPDILPAAWPQFSRLPDEKPLAPKSTKAKIDGARSMMTRWAAYKADKSKSYPSDAEVSDAVRYLLTIDRSDPGFPEAWTVFIDLRKDADDITRWRATKAAEETLKRQAEIDKREAKKRGVHVGMTQEEALGSSWGRPTGGTNTTVTAGGKHEQWVYGGGNYLYFENGILRSIQTGR